MTSKIGRKLLRWLGDVGSNGLRVRIFEPHGSNYLVMDCNYCDGTCTKAGKQADGKQKYQCKSCRKYQQADYQNKAWEVGTDAQVTVHVKEGCGIWNIARLLHISKTTVIARIKRIALGINPVLAMPEGGSYEVDELHTFIGIKAKECYVSYAISKETRQAVDFVTGS